MKREKETTQTTFMKIFCMNEFQNRKAALCMHGHGGWKTKEVKTQGYDLSPSFDLVPLPQFCKIKDTKEYIRLGP